MKITEDEAHKGGSDTQNKDDVWRVAPTRPIKRSFSISGHRTSISLENAFWEALREIASSQERSLASLVAEIDRKRAEAGLSGAVRVYVLDYYRHQSAKCRKSEKNTY